MKAYSHDNVVYKIHCQDCDATYVGQSKRQLKTRIQEHKNDIKKSIAQSVISTHELETNHQFDWQDTKILESSYHKRLYQK